jgi:hypothetical protein
VFVGLNLKYFHFSYHCQHMAFSRNPITPRGKDANGNSGAAVSAFLYFVGAFQDPTKYKKSRNRQPILVE